jgi:hypothetical protein
MRTLLVLEVGGVIVAAVGVIAYLRRHRKTRLECTGDAVYSV